MHSLTRVPIRLTAALAVTLALALSSGPVSGHEARNVAGYDLEVGFIDEPVYSGQKSGLELHVEKAGTPVDGLDRTLKAQVVYGTATRDLPISPRFDAPGWYQSYFVPTAAGPYTFHISGTIEGAAVDETFTSSPTGFNEVLETRANEFPVQFPTQAELVDQAAQGAKAAGQVTTAMALGAAGLLAGIVALGVALAGRRRHS
jgi:hypothetical protein